MSKFNELVKVIGGGGIAGLDSVVRSSVFSKLCRNTCVHLGRVCFFVF